MEEGLVGKMGDSGEWVVQSRLFGCAWFGRLNTDELDFRISGKQARMDTFVNLVPAQFRWECARRMESDPTDLPGRIHYVGLRPETAGEGEMQGQLSPADVSPSSLHVNRGQKYNRPRPGVEQMTGKMSSARR